MLKFNLKQDEIYNFLYTLKTYKKNVTAWLKNSVKEGIYQ